MLLLLYNRKTHDWKSDKKELLTQDEPASVPRGVRNRCGKWVQTRINGRKTDISGGGGDGTGVVDAGSQAGSCVDTLLSRDVVSVFMTLSRDFFVPCDLHFV
jgi:hypothetical protein